MDAIPHPYKGRLSACRLDSVIFSPTPLEGAWLLELERRADERGFFARTWCVNELAERGLETRVVQESMSRTARRGTLRGMHWQTAPHDEVKLVTCARGAIWDVIVDLRPSSKTYLRHFGTRLDAESSTTLYIPAGFAHGFVTLDDDTDVLYRMSAFHAPEAARGARWNDPALGIEWPVSAPVVNERDASYPDLIPERPS